MPYYNLYNMSLTLGLAPNAMGQLDRMHRAVAWLSNLSIGWFATGSYNKAEKLLHAFLLAVNMRPALPASSTWGRALNTCHCLGPLLRCRVCYCLYVLYQTYYSDGFINNTTRIDKVMRALAGRKGGRQPNQKVHLCQRLQRWSSWVESHMGLQVLNQVTFSFFVGSQRQYFLCCYCFFQFAVRYRYCLGTRDE